MYIGKQQILQNIQHNRQKTSQQSENKQKKHKSNKFSSRYAITFGQCSILHIGSQELGQMAQNLFSVAELQEIGDKMKQQYGIQYNLVNLTLTLPEDRRQGNQAAVLYLPQAANFLIGDEEAADCLYQEQNEIEYDKKYFDHRRKRTLNKQARFNIVFGQEERVASEDFKDFSIKAFSNLKYLQRFRWEIGRHFGQKAKNLNAEGNRYYDQKSGIGFHGDSQRKIVICLNLGKNSTLRYYWRTPNHSDNKFGPIDIQVKHGDVYIMSEKASGYDWRHRSKYRLVHAAGSTKYIGKN